MTDTWPKPDWECEGVRLYCGDCLEILPQLPAGCIDAVVTDPPYGIAQTSNHGASWAGKRIAGDESVASRDAVLALFPNAPFAVFGTWKRRTPARTRAALVWDKGPAFGMGDLSLPWKASWETIFVGGKGWQGHRGEGVLRGHLVVSWESAGRTHPMEKPVSLIRALIDKLPAPLSILDPFMGSGTTGVACVQTGREFVGIEIDPRYFDIAVTRIDQERRQGRMDFG